MRKSSFNISYLFIFVFFASVLYSCKKDDKKAPGNETYALVVQTGAKSIAPDEQVTYTAVLVNKNGETSTPANVTWTVSNSLGSFTGNTFKATTTGTGKVTATAVVDGSTLTASAPIGIAATSVFTVAPAAIIWNTNSGTIQLTPVYLSTNPAGTYTYTSSNPAVATVNTTGVVSFVAAGECTITVKANGIDGTPSVVVPVLVLGNPTITLPVAKVTVSPASYQMFRNETTTITAKAYDMNNTEVTGKTFTWQSEDANIATVSATGVVTAKNIGSTTVTATTSGISGQVEIDVLPDTTIIVTPYFASIGAGGTKQFSASVYTVNHSTKSLNVPAIATNPTGITWSIPTYGIPLLDIATVGASSGLVSVKSSATTGLSTVVMASMGNSATIEPGVAMITVSLPCDCGTANPDVANITGVPSTLNITYSIIPPATSQISAQAVDAFNAPVSGATLHYCSDNPVVCTVDSNGLITAISQGSATITVCCGNGVQKTIAVTVN